MLHCIYYYYTIVVIIVESYVCQRIDGTLESCNRLIAPQTYCIFYEKVRLCSWVSLQLWKRSEATVLMAKQGMKDGHKSKGRDR